MSCRRGSGLTYICLTRSRGRPCLCREERWPHPRHGTYNGHPEQLRQTVAVSSSSSGDRLMSSVGAAGSRTSGRWQPATRIWVARRKPTHSIATCDGDAHRLPKVTHKPPTIGGRTAGLFAIRRGPRVPDRRVTWPWSAVSTADHSFAWVPPVQAADKPSGCRSARGTSAPAALRANARPCGPASGA
jgi:hypothetical protein